MPITHEFPEALVSPERSPELAGVDDIFGSVIGSWDLEAEVHYPDGHTQKTKGELHASWVLEGRAIQDLFIYPRRADRSKGVPSHGDRYGTTIRTFDRKLNAWRVEFINPADDETSGELLARRRDHGIVMDGKLRNGTLIRWSYPTISPSSFHYVAEQMNPEDKSWRVYLELFGTRASK